MYSSYRLPPWCASIALTNSRLFIETAPSGEGAMPMGDNSGFHAFPAVIGAVDPTRQTRNPGETCPRFC